MSTQIKFYTDEHTARAVVAGLRRHGIDVLTTREAGMMGAIDEDHLRLATSLGRVLFTEDQDYLRIHATGFQHSGIAYALPHTSIGKMIEGLALIYEVMTMDEMQNKVEFL